jgi:hypothetical protein
MQMTERQLVYLYCVTEKEPKLKEVECLADNLHSVHHKGLCGVAGNVEDSEFGEENLKRNLVDWEWVRAKATTHEKVIEGIMKDTCVIPFKFGTLFNTDDGLKTMLEVYGEEFKTILGKLKNKQEWGVKIYCDTQKLKSGLANRQPEILELENEIKSSPVGKAYLLKKKKAELIEQAVNKKINQCGRRSFALLKNLSSATRINRLLPKEVTEREDDMILNSAFLVGNDSVQDFVGLAKSLKTQCKGAGFSVDCTGPWPPYNFCSLPKVRGQNG